MAADKAPAHRVILQVLHSRKELIEHGLWKIGEIVTGTSLFYRESCLQKYESDEERLQRCGFQ